MTTVVIDKTKPKKFILKSTGHCSHDVCIAITALINSIVQYANDFADAERCTVDTVYDFGNVTLEVDFFNKFHKKDFIRGTDALINGLALYQHNFREDVLLKNKKHRGNIAKI